MTTTPGMTDWFESAEAAEKVLEKSVNAILNHPDALTEDQKVNLAAILRDYLDGGGVTYGADFDLKAEVTQQIRAVRAMRDQVIDEHGRIRHNMQPRDAKEVVSTSTTLLNTLMKVHERVINYDRLKAVEDATIEAVKTLSAEAQQAFFTELEWRLAQIG